MTAMPEALARRIFEVATAEKRCAELLECLFEGGSVTLDATVPTIVLASAEVITQLVTPSSDEPTSMGHPYPSWAARAAELRANLYDRFVDGDVIDDGTGAVAIPIEVAVDTAYDLMTDGDNNAFFNRCPACGCGCSGEANSDDCACWCHSFDEGWKVWDDRMTLANDLAKAATMVLAAEIDRGTGQEAVRALAGLREALADYQWTRD